jgi:ubiquitin C-terminal hydrolase
LSEDLYRKPRKPYVEMADAKGESDARDSEEAWTKHLIRNESVVVDLFHGQYKSTLICSTCNHVSVTFDPFMTLPLPIPGKKKKFNFFYISYKIDKDYYNFSGNLSLRES